MFQRLLVPVDGAELSARAIDQSIELARQLGAAITGFVAEPPAPEPSESVDPAAMGKTVSVEEQRGAEHARVLLNRFEKQAREAGVPFEGEYTQAHNISKAIVEAAERHHCDMIVMVTHGRSRLSKFLLGSNTKAVLGRSPVPLLVLH